MHPTRPRLSIACILRDPLPPERSDVLALFGAELRRHGIATDLIGQAGSGAAPRAWEGGALHAVGRLDNRLAPLLAPCWDALGLLRSWRRAPPDCIQVRDKIAGGLLGRAAAAVLGRPFVYWMSFPVVEGFEARRDQLGEGGRGALWLAHAARAAISRRMFYRMVLPAARHIFVQSEAMARWLESQGVPRARMTAVPMGVDARLLSRDAVAPSTDPRLDGRRVVAYLGRVARSRQSGFLLDVAEALRVRAPRVLLVIAGDAPSAGEMAWMRCAIAARGLGGHVLLTGWLPREEALGYVVRAEIGLSPIPRGVLFDVSSPTKLVEYMALGIPCVASDIPDQRLVIAQSGAGLCVPMEPAAFSAAVIELLGDSARAARLATRGPDWVRANRSYEVLGREVAAVYGRLFPDRLA